MKSIFPPIALFLVGIVFLCSFSLVRSEASGQGGSESGDKNLTFYIGTYTGTTSEGIYRCTLDTENASLGKPELAVAAPNPSFLVFDPALSILYSVNETEDFEGKASGFVSSYKVDPATGALQLAGRASSGGKGPCHLGLGASGQIVATANYGDGTVAISAIDTNGSITPPTQVVRHSGSGPDSSRQKGPHAHSANFGPRDILYVADLGVDKVFLYALDVESARVAESSPPYLELAPGSGPRHVAFNRAGTEMYVVNELNSTVTRFRPFSQTPDKPLQTITTLPSDFTGKNWPAEITVSPDGRFLYVSNRGHDSLAIFRITQGGLEAVGFAATEGRNPRHFSFDPSGDFLIVANQDSDNLVLFRVDKETGQLTKTSSEVAVGRPVCILFP
ncbi:MAG: lactonase family protein [Acidobacteriota bacterium]|nr:MAG: lactonase family protein [Acidobacteriota bacterium]